MKTLRTSARRGDAGFSIRAGADDTAEVLIYDQIGGWDGIVAKDLVPQLKAITAATIHVRVNSPGGDVFDGITIANALKAHPANVIVHIDGLAASIASIIALAGDEVRMAENAFLMIHNPWTFAIGNAADFRKTADTLDTISGALIDTYVKKTGASRADVIAWMDEETWLNAEDALAEGFVDAVDGVDSEGEAVAARFDLSVFAKTPAELNERRASIAASAAKDVPTKRTIERALRDAGCSRTHAKAVAALADKALAQRDAGDDGAQQHDAAVLAAIDSIIASTK